MAHELSDHAGLEGWVAPGMLGQVVAAHEPLLTEWAGKALLPSVRAEVASQLIRARKALLATGPVAGEGSLTCARKTKQDTSDNWLARQRLPGGKAGLLLCTNCAWNQNSATTLPICPERTLGRGQKGPLEGMFQACPISSVKYHHLLLPLLHILCAHTPQVNSVFLPRLKCT